MKNNILILIVLACLCGAALPQRKSNSRKSSLPAQGGESDISKAKSKNGVDVPPEKPSTDSEPSKWQLIDSMKKIYGGSEFRIQDIKARTDPRDTASGVEVQKTSETITIDTTPCSGDKRLVTFHRIYKKDEISDITCGSNKYKRVEVEQQ